MTTPFDAWQIERGSGADAVDRTAICKHCGLLIIRDDYGSWWLGRDLWYHDDLVDGSTDRPCSGEMCRDGENEAEPLGEKPKERA